MTEVSFTCEILLQKLCGRRGTWLRSLNSNVSDTLHEIVKWIEVAKVDSV